MKRRWHVKAAALVVVIGLLGLPGAPPAQLLGIVPAPVPALTPDQVKSALEGAATPMPGYQEYQVGAGYLNAYRAVTTALTLAWNGTGGAARKTAERHPGIRAPLAESPA